MPADLIKQLRNFIFSITLTGYKKCSPGLSRESHNHMFHSIHYICSGKGIYRMNGNTYTAEAGTVFVFVPGTKLMWFFAEGLEFYHIRFDPKQCLNKNNSWSLLELEPTSFPFFGSYGVIRPCEIRQRFEEVHAQWNSPDPYSQYACDIAFRALWLSLAENLRDLSNTGDAVAAVRDSITYLQNHYQKQITVTGLARMTGISSGHYTRLFKRLTGFTPKEYIIQIRINKAKELLAYNNLPLKEVASQAGYDDELYFSKLFKQAVGVAPTIYKSGMEKQSDLEMLD